MRGYPGCLITLEGGEGAGKTTQVQSLERELSQDGHKVVTLREPGGTFYGQKIREVLLNPYPDEDLDSGAEMFLYLASRRQNVSLNLEPALVAGKIAIMDRFVDSTLAYQGYGRGLDVDQLRELNQIATKGINPDLTVLLDMDPKLGFTRIQGVREKDRLEQERISFFHKIRAGFLSLAEREPTRIVIVDASRDVQSVYTDIRNAVYAKLEELGF